MPSGLARRTRTIWQSWHVPALSALLPALPGTSRIRLRSASTGLLRQPGEKAFHLLRLPAPHGAPAPRGALVVHPAPHDRVDPPCEVRFGETSSLVQPPGPHYRADLVQGVLADRR